MAIETLGDVVERRLEDLDMSLRELGRRMEITHPSLNQMMSGQIKPRIETMERLARALEIPPETFLEYRLEALREKLEWRPPPDNRSRTVRVARLEAAAKELERFED